MDVLTLYVGQGALAAVRAGGEVVIVDAHMPTGDDVTQGEIEATLRDYVGTHHVRGLVLTGLDADHAHADGVDSILTNQRPDWVMYPKCYKDSDSASSVFDTIDRHERRRAKTSHPLRRHSVRLDRIDSRILNELGNHFDAELFSPHIEDMDTSNNSSVVLKLTGRDATGFSYLATGDTETDRWERISELFAAELRAHVMAAPHHGSRTGVHAASLLHVSPHTVLISAGVESQYGHPHAAAVTAYRKVATHVFATNAGGEATCLFTRPVAGGFDTRLVRHSDATPIHD
jgi:beta-lactamase superfamily II metal-dependent hydrolase